MADQAVQEVMGSSDGAALARLGPLLLPLAALEPEVVREVLLLSSHPAALLPALIRYLSGGGVGGGDGWVGRLWRRHS